MTRDHSHFIHFCQMSHRWGRPLNTTGQFTPSSPNLNLIIIILIYLGNNHYKDYISDMHNYSNSSSIPQEKVPMTALFFLTYRAKSALSNVSVPEQLIVYFCKLWLVKETCSQNADKMNPNIDYVSTGVGANIMNLDYRFPVSLIIKTAHIS